MDAPSFAYRTFEDQWLNQEGVDQQQANLRRSNAMEKHVPNASMDS